MATPGVSIIIPNYNLGRYIAEAIASARAQTVAPLEIIVVDDGSTDDSVAIVERLPVALVRQPNGGVARARNTGAVCSKGEHLVFLDADDLLHPTYVERCLAALARSGPRVAYAYTDMQLFGTQNYIFRARAFCKKTLLKSNFVHASALVHRDVLFEVGGWNPAWNIGYEDHELWVRMLKHGYGGVYVPGALLRYRRHGPSRNQLTQEVAAALFWKVAVTYPDLYLNKIRKSPWQAFRAFQKERANRVR